VVSRITQLSVGGPGTDPGRKDAPMEWCVESGRDDRQAARSSVFLTDTARITILCTRVLHVCRQGSTVAKVGSGFRSGYRQGGGRLAFDGLACLGEGMLVNPRPRERIKSVAAPDGLRRTPRPKPGYGRSRTIGVVVATIADPFVAEVVQGVETTAHTTDTRSCSRVRARSRFARLRRWRCCAPSASDGLIVTASRIGALYWTRRAPGRARRPDQQPQRTGGHYTTP
jgi:hypothetical protein